MIPRILDAQTEGQTHNLIVRFSDGKKMRYDVSKLFTTGNFERLKNWGYFKNFHVAPGGYAIVWDDDTDLSENELYKRGHEVAS